jgi:putative nucleotidyltransferase with HDIG domain
MPELYTSHNVMKPSPNVDSTDLPELLAGLAAGADQKLFTVNDWAARLNDSELARQFIDQMRQEWLPMTVPDGLCQEMMDSTRTYLSWYLGWPHLWAHTLRVTGTALTLAPEAGIDPAHAFMLGIFHDIGKLDEMSGGEEHEEVGAQILHEKLTGHYSRHEIILMANVVAKKASPANPYVQLLQDADKLDKIGATGIARRLSTRWGAEHIRFALGRVKDDADSLPDMHFPTSHRLVKSKLDYTEEFLQLARVKN